MHILQPLPFQNMPFKKENGGILVETAGKVNGCNEGAKVNQSAAEAGAHLRFHLLGVVIVEVLPMPMLPIGNWYWIFAQWQHLQGLGF